MATEMTVPNSASASAITTNTEARIGPRRRRPIQPAAAHDETARPASQGPQQAPGTRGGEVEREAEPEEAVRGPDDAQVRRADLENLGLGAEEDEPMCREERGGTGAQT